MISFHATLRRIISLATLLTLVYAVDCSAQVPTLKQAMDSDVDVWAEAALKQPGGPSYEFFETLLPPLRYVDANFHVYPIVLSAPTSATKARFVSNGSAVNAQARQPDWNGQPGTPVTFLVGEERDIFGLNPAQLDGPHFADGYLPIVQLTYAAHGASYSEEAFASTDPQLADLGVVFVKLTLNKASGRNYKVAPAKDKDPASTAPVAGVEAAENLALINRDFDEKIEALFEAPEQYHLKDNRLLSKDNQVIAMIHPRWITNPGRAALITPMKTGESSYIAIFTKPADSASISFKLTPETYESQRQACIKTWNDILAHGVQIETPEPIVNNAWRASIIGNFMLIHDGEMRYSAGNQYGKIYIAEGGDAIKSLCLFGQFDEARKLMPAQFAYTRKGLEFHQAAQKLQMLGQFFRLSRDVEYIQSTRASWQKEIDVILKGRQTENGMFPREKYCGDIDTRVFSLNSNSGCWRGLRDMSVMLDQIGQKEQSQRLATVAAEYRKIILAAIDHATQRDIDAPFVPIALSGEENAHDPIWATTIGSYWNLMIEYVLGSGVFTSDSQTATDIVHYLQTKGGLCMGMLRARATPGNFWMSGGRINDLYGTRYALTLLRRDEPDRALVSFYGKLAQGMTRDTFIGCEGSGMNPLDEFGRQMYLPPNSAANSNFLQQFRYLLVQDYDMDDDGVAETLRLCFATPRAWLADGKTIKVTNAPTEFGPVSFTIQSKVASGVLDIDLDLPTRNPPAKTLLRLRLPDGAKIVDAKDGETLDISNLHGHATMQVKTTK